MFAPLSNQTRILLTRSEVARALGLPETACRRLLSRTGIEPMASAGEGRIQLFTPEVVEQLRTAEREHQEPTIPIS